MAKLSVIVPVYNVEPYLKECLDSLIAQTYSDLEIIIVNDGSTDDSEKICNEYARIDNRIIYIQKENGGLSSARNAGLPYASGEYISFIDSDDYIVPNMFSDLITIAESTDADMVCCDYFEFRDKPRKSFSIGINDQFISYYTSSEAKKKMLYPNYFKCFACNKIYRANLFDTIRFPDGKLFEDIYTCFLLLNISKKIVYYKQPLYGYRIRENSISREKYNSRSSELIEAIDQVMNSIDTKAPEYEDTLCGYVFYYMTFINLMIRANVKEEKYGVHIRRVIRDNYHVIAKSKDLGKVRKLQFWLYAHFASVYKVIVRVI